MRIFIVLLFITSLSAAQSQTFDWNFLDTKTTGAYKFIKENPEYDGRGALIFILDCGVDPLVPGLQQTSEGRHKVIDMKDFTGQTAVKLKPAEINDVNGEKKAAWEEYFLSGFNDLKIKPSDGKYFLAVLDENKYFKNSAVSDINNNGKSDDIFLFLAFKVTINKEMIENMKGIAKPDENSEIWVYIPDTDMDMNIADEKPMFDYKYDFDIFDFVSPLSSKTPPFTMSAYIENGSLIINTNDGAHGSHCAGIAAGFKIYGAEGNNGIAPGAYIVSLKIGSNALSGGATTTESMKKAYEYGIDFMKETGFKHAVFSMSYGIGSESASKGDVDKFMEKFAYGNPNIIICKSMGNAGPGINSTGNPAGASGILSVGAMIAPKTLRDLYGSKRSKNWISHFSSRGGEVPKPDVVAPAAAQSTVPEFQKGEAFWGTSMSTPEAAGIAALLISAADKNNLIYDGQMIRRAIKCSAQPLHGYSVIDYGCGLVNVQKAFDYLKILAERNEQKKVLDFDISTQNTYFDDGRGPAAFYKANGWSPDKNESVEVSVKAVFPKNMPDSEKSSFYRAWNLECDAGWLAADKSSLYLRSDQKAVFNLIIDRSKIKRPGVYSAKVFAYTGNEKNGGYPDFDVQAAVVKPYKFSAGNDYSILIKNQKLGIGDIERIFIQVPPGASAMNLRLNSSESGEAAMYLFDPEGNRAGFSLAKNGSVSFEISGCDLKNGIWEAVPYCYYKSPSDISYDFSAVFYGIRSDNEIIQSYLHEIGKKPEFSVHLLNLYEKPAYTFAEANIAGYARNNIEKKSCPCPIEKKITIEENIEKYHAEIIFPEDIFNKTTDIAVIIKNTEGKDIVSSGLSRKSGEVSFKPPSSGVYTLEISPAFISKESVSEGWRCELNEEYYYDKSVSISSSSEIELLPGIWKEAGFKFSQAIPVSPDGTYSFGKVLLKDKKTKDMVKEIKIELKK